MVATLIALMALALFHFVYESIVAPDLRLWLTSKLYGLRKEASLLKLECAGTAAELNCILLQESINVLISELRRISLASLVGIEIESRKNPGFLARATQRLRMLDECTSPRIQEIRAQCLDIATKALAVNSIGWAALLVAPWAIASVGISASKTRLRVLVLLNSGEFQRISPFKSANEALI